MIVHETPEELTVDGVPMRTLPQRYGDKTALKPLDSLHHALRYTPSAPITLHHPTGTHVGPEEEHRQVGVFTAHHVSRDGRLHGRYVFWKPETPASILEKLRSGTPVPTSVGFDYVEGPPGDGYDYSQDRIRLGHIAVYPEEGAQFDPRCRLAQGCGVGVDASVGSDPTVTDETRLIGYDAVYLGNEGEPMPSDNPIPDSHPADDSLAIGRPIESATPPIPPKGKPAGDTVQPPPCPDAGKGAKDHAPAYTALDALREACVDLDPSLKEAVQSIDSPTALRQLLKRATDVLTAADAALPMGQPDPRTADPYNLSRLRQDQVAGYKDYLKSSYQYTRTKYLGGA